MGPITALALPMLFLTKMEKGIDPAGDNEGDSPGDDRDWQDYLNKLDELEADE